MGIIDEIQKAVNNSAEVVLKNSERWNVGQKIVAFLVCLIAAAALVSGGEFLRVSSGVTIALFGIAFLTFRRRVVESETLLLKDAHGRPRIAMSAEGGIVLFDEAGRSRIVANIFNGQPFIYMRDDQESVLIGVDEKHGATVALVQNDMSGCRVNIRRKGLDLGSPQAARLWLRAEGNDAHVSLDRADKTSGMYLSISDDAAQARIGHLNGANVCVTAAPDGNLGVLLINEKGETPVMLGSSGNSGHLSFVGEKGLPVAKYPDDSALREYARVVAGA